MAARIREAYRKYPENPKSCMRVYHRGDIGCFCSKARGHTSNRPGGWVYAWWTPFTSGRSHCSRNGAHPGVHLLIWPHACLPRGRRSWTMTQGSPSTSSGNPGHGTSGTFSPRLRHSIPLCERPALEPPHTHDGTRATPLMNAGDDHQSSASPTEVDQESPESQDPLIRLPGQGGHFRECHDV